METMKAFEFEFEFEANPVSRMFRNITYIGTRGPFY